MDFDKDLARRAVHYLFFIVTILMVISGFGIVDYQIAGALSGGLLTKALCFEIHYGLAIPFAILLILHIGIVLFLKKGRK